MKPETLIGGTVVVVTILALLFAARYVNNNWPVWKAKLAEKFKKND